MIDSLDKTELDVLFTHTYHQVTITSSANGFRFSMPGLRSEALAEELAAILRPCFPSQNVRVIWVAANPNDDLQSFLTQDSRMTDLIVSVRTAVDPGHELLSRLGFFGEYTGLAPQAGSSQFCGAGGAA